MQSIYKEYINRGGDDGRLYLFISWATEKAKKYKMQFNLTCITDLNHYVNWIQNEYKK